MGVIFLAHLLFLPILTLLAVVEIIKTVDCYNELFRYLVELFLVRYISLDCCRYLVKL
jgi:hypothetical protein